MDGGPNGGWPDLLFHPGEERSHRPMRIQRRRFSVAARPAAACPQSSDAHFMLVGLRPPFGGRSRVQAPGIRGSGEAMKEPT